MAYDRILVPVDGSAPSSAGLAQALRLCAPGTQVKLLHVLENPTYAYGAMDYALDYDELFAAQEVQGWKTLESAAAAAKKRKVKALPELVEARGRRVAEVIGREAERWKADLVVMGSHGRRGMTRVLLGSDAETVVRSTRVPLLLTRAGKGIKVSRAANFRRIVVPLDGSATSKAGLAAAVQIASHSGATLQLVHVIDVAPGFHVPGGGSVLANIRSSLHKRGEQLLNEGIEIAHAEGVKAGSCLLQKSVGPAADAITAEARRWKADLIVIGTHGRRGLARALMGSDAELVVRQAETPVLLIHGRGKR